MSQKVLFAVIQNLTRRKTEIASAGASQRRSGRAFSCHLNLRHPLHCMATQTAFMNKAQLMIDDVPGPEDARAYGADRNG